MQNFFGQYQNNQTPQNIIVPVMNENVARSFPVAYGNTVVFKDEREPYIYIKSMGYSQLESPVFEKYVRESQKEPIPDPKINNLNTLSSEDIEAEIKAIRSEIDTIKEQISKPKRTKKEVTEDDE